MKFKMIVEVAVAASALASMRRRIADLKRHMREFPDSEASNYFETRLKELESEADAFEAAYDAAELT